MLRAFMAKLYQEIAQLMMSDTATEISKGVTIVDAFDVVTLYVR
jgi:hypothetical protein